MKKVVWLARAFLDYRAPVIEELYDKYGASFYVVISNKWMATHIKERLKIKLGHNLICLDDEITIGTKDLGKKLANTAFRLPLQPGLIKCLRKIQPDVVLGDGFFQWTLYAYLYKAISKCKVVVCYERTEHTERNSQWYRKLYRKSMCKLTHSYCVNGKLTTEYLQRIGVDRDKIFEGYMVHEDKGYIPKKHIERNNKKTLLFVGQLIERKGVDLLIESWLRVLKDKESVRLHIVGEGPLKAKILSRLNAEKCHNVVLFGKVPHHKIPEQYINCDMFIMPTLEDNWSLVVPEAMSFAKPIITSIYNGCYPELINSSTGLVVDPHIKEEMDSAIEFFSHTSSDKLYNMGIDSFNLIKKRNPKSASLAITQAIEYNR